MNRIQLEWLHFRMRIWGDSQFEKTGGGMLPCRHCGKLFYSYNHFDYYDELCEWCSYTTRDPKEMKFVIQNALTDYNSDVADWDTTKATLLSYGIKIRYCPKSKRCALQNCELQGYEPSLGYIIKTYPNFLPTYKAAKMWLQSTKLKPKDRLCRNCFCWLYPNAEYAKED